MSIMCCYFIIDFNNMYEYGIDDVNCFWLEGITKCDLAWWSCFVLVSGGHGFKPWWVKNKL